MFKKNMIGVYLLIYMYMFILKIQVHVGVLGNHFLGIHRYPLHFFVVDIYMCVDAKLI